VKYWEFSGQTKNENPWDVSLKILNQNSAKFNPKK
jgi:hypothetical protein